MKRLFASLGLAAALAAGCSSSPAPDAGTDGGQTCLLVADSGTCPQGQSCVATDAGASCVPNPVPDSGMHPPDGGFDGGQVPFQDGGSGVALPFGAGGPIFGLASAGPEVLAFGTTLWLGDGGAWTDLSPTLLGAVDGCNGGDYTTGFELVGVDATPTVWLASVFDTVNVEFLASADQGGNWRRFTEVMGPTLRAHAVTVDPGSGAAWLWLLTQNGDAGAELSALGVPGTASGDAGTIAVANPTGANWGCANLAPADGGRLLLGDPGLNELDVISLAQGQAGLLRLPLAGSGYVPAAGGICPTQLGPLAWASSAAAQQSEDLAFVGGGPLDAGTGSLWSVRLDLGDAGRALPVAYFVDAGADLLQAYRDPNGSGNALWVTAGGSLAVVGLSSDQTALSVESTHALPAPLTSLSAALGTLLAGTAHGVIDLGPLPSSSAAPALPSVGLQGEVLSSFRPGTSVLFALDDLVRSPDGQTTPEVFRTSGTGSPLAPVSGGNGTVLCPNLAPLDDHSALSACADGTVLFWRDDGGVSVTQGAGFAPGPLEVLVPSGNLPVLVIALADAGLQFTQFDPVDAGFLNPFSATELGTNTWVSPPGGNTPTAYSLDSLGRLFAIEADGGGNGEGVVPGDVGAVDPTDGTRFSMVGHDAGMVGGAARQSFLFECQVDPTSPQTLTSSTLCELPNEVTQLAFDNAGNLWILEQPAPPSYSPWAEDLEPLKPQLYFISKHDRDNLQGQLPIPPCPAFNLEFGTGPTCGPKPFLLREPVLELGVAPDGSAVFLRGGRHTLEITR